jgi:hypothetical protein
LNADPRERFFDLVELEGFDNRFDLLHIVSSREFWIERRSGYASSVPQVEK